MDRQAPHPTDPNTSEHVTCFNYLRWVTVSLSCDPVTLGWVQLLKSPEEAGRHGLSRLAVSVTTGPHQHPRLTVGREASCYCDTRGPDRGALHDRVRPVGGAVHDLVPRDSSLHLTCLCPDFLRGTSDFYLPGSRQALSCILRTPNLAPVHGDG